MSTTQRALNTQELEQRVKDMYREVAEEPFNEFHFETGRQLAEGSEGRVIGIDMTEAQLAKATRLATEHGFANVEFRNSYIEQLPLDSGSADVVISNGVINLSPHKAKVFAEAARILRPDGRLAIADIVTATQLPEGVTCDAALWAACIGGAMQRDDYREAIEAAGFQLDYLRENGQYRFVSERAANATQKYGVKSVSLLAIKN